MINKAEAELSTPLSIAGFGAGKATAAHSSSAELSSIVRATI
ncbi:hypothetical protein [Amycolatopsis keratiniphila]|nr:hypothetical protein [Amycolatopsis keratiniphila]